MQMTEPPVVYDLTGAPIPWVDVVSTNVRRVLWRFEGRRGDHNVGALYVQFSSGAVYVYEDVTRALYDALLAADSKGGYVARYVKGQHATSRVDVAARMHALLPDDDRGAAA